MLQYREVRASQGFWLRSTPTLTLDPLGIKSIWHDCSELSADTFNILGYSISTYF
jgi:hypothetical protein